jgi:hypothetical protein
MASLQKTSMPVGSEEKDAAMKEKVGVSAPESETEGASSRAIFLDPLGKELFPPPTLDPLDPLNWPKWRKYICIFIVMYMYFLFTYFTIGER